VGLPWRSWKERLMGAREGDGGHGGGRPEEAGQGEGVSASLRLLVVQNDPESGPGTLERALMAGGADLEFWLPFRGEAAPPLEGFAGVLAFGGTVNPDEDEEEPWLSEVRGRLGEVLERGLPFLGVCLGGQLLAQAAGGEASSETHPSEIGWSRLEVADETGHDPLFGGLRDGERVFQHHSYGISAPPGATVLATTKGDHQLFRVGETAWGVQFHLEVDLPVLAIKLVTSLDELKQDSIDAKALREESARHVDRLRELGEQVAYRFLALCTHDTTKGDA
jgi:GMP synthase (glutamine-hydrolysing)